MAQLVLPEESYKLMNLFFKVHNELGSCCKEKNYQDAIEVLLKQQKINYEREKELSMPFAGEELKGFFADFVIDNKIILEVKAKSFIENEDVRQVLRYLKASGYSLAIIANFKRQKLEYKRIINPHSSNIRGIRDKLENNNNIRASFGRVRGKVLGIDYGDKKIGLAKGDTNLKIALPLKILENKNQKFVLEELKKIIIEEDIKEIVVGVPLSLGGGNLRPVDFKNEQMKKVLVFISWLKANFKIPVLTEDERFSTKMANNLHKGLAKKKSEDAVAAMLILQGYLDRNF